MAKEKYENDLEECKARLIALLREYNCELQDGDVGTWIELVDKDTKEVAQLGCCFM